MRLVTRNVRDFNYPGLEVVNPFGRVRGEARNCEKFHGPKNLSMVLIIVNSESSALHNPLYVLALFFAGWKKLFQTALNF
jgi:hypothetical protein